MGPPQVPRVPPLLALFLGDPGPVDGPPDRYGALVHRLPAPAQCRGQRRRLPWKGGRKNWDTATIVFEYGPLDYPTKGFQVVYASRMTNGAGGTKELYYSNAGMLNLDTNEISPNGGPPERSPAELSRKTKPPPTL